MKKKILFILLCCGIVSLSFLSDVANYIHTPSDRFFWAPHNFPPDHNMFLSEINQASVGKFLFIDKFTPEPQTGNIIHPLYILVGIFTGITHIPAYQSYQLIRFINGVLLLLTTMWFMKQVFPNNKLAQNLGFLFAALMPGYVKIVNSPDGIGLTKNLIDWSGSDLLVRNAFQPHAMIKTILFLIVFVLYSRGIPSDKYQRLILSLLSGLMILFEPTFMVILVLIWIILSSKELIKSIRKNEYSNEFMKKMIALTIIALPSLISFIYMFHAFTGQEWAIVKDWEKRTNFYINPVEYILSFGPLLILSIPGFILFLKKNNTLFISMITCFALTILLLFYSPITQILGLTNFRFFGIPLYIFFSAATAKFVLTILRVFSKNKATVLLIILLVLFIHAPLYILMNFENYRKPILIQEGFNRYNYPLKTTYNGLLWLKENTNQDDVVFSNGYIGNLIPGVSGNTVVLGHQVSTINYWDKDHTFYDFIQQIDLPEESAIRYLKKYQIKYVLIEYTESNINRVDNYKFMTKVFDNIAVKIYKVNL
jgi:hypothetical protein